MKLGSRGARHPSQAHAANEQQRQDSNRRLSIWLPGPSSLRPAPRPRRPGCRRLPPKMPLVCSRELSFAPCRGRAANSDVHGGHVGVQGRGGGDRGAPAWQDVRGFRSQASGRACVVARAVGVVHALRRVRHPSAAAWRPAVGGAPPPRRQAAPRPSSLVLVADGRGRASRGGPWPSFSLSSGRCGQGRLCWAEGPLWGPDIAPTRDA